MKRNRRKDIFLDFTSLLDVTLLLLFFFVMTFQADVTNAKDNAEQRANAAELEAQHHIQNAKAAEAEAEKSRIRYEDLIQENAELQLKLKNDIQIVDQLTSEEANEIVAFNSGNNLKLLLQDSGSSARPMTLRVILNKKEIGECLVTRDTDTEEDRANDISAGRLAGWMTANGLRKDAVIMCDFIYDSGAGRSNKAYSKITEIVKEIQNERGYRHFYCSETDISKESE